MRPSARVRLACGQEAGAQSASATAASSLRIGLAFMMLGPPHGTGWEHSINWGELRAILGKWPFAKALRTPGGASPDRVGIPDTEVGTQTARSGPHRAYDGRWS